MDTGIPDKAGGPVKHFKFRADNQCHRPTLKTLYRRKAVFLGTKQRAVPFVWNARIKIYT